MAIRRTRTNLEDHYTQLDNEWLRDGRISLKARGLFAQILSHREGWRISIASLVRANPEGESAIRSALNELIEYGYLVRGERERNEQGHLGDYEYTLWAGRGLPTVDQPDQENPTLENPRQDNPTPKKNISKKEHLEEHPPTPQGGGEREKEFDSLWSAWPRKVGKPAAQKAYVAATKRAKPGVIAAGLYSAVQFFARERTEIRFVPHLSTWLNQNRWEDELTPTNQPVAPVEGSGPRLAPDEKLIDGIIWRRGRPRLGGQYGMTVAQYQEWQAEQQRLIQEARDRRG